MVELLLFERMEAKQSALQMRSQVRIVRDPVSPVLEDPAVRVYAAAVFEAPVQSPNDRATFAEMHKDAHPIYKHVRGM
jgi:hypothetical protein